MDLDLEQAEQFDESTLALDEPINIRICFLDHWSGEKSGDSKKLSGQVKACGNI